MLFNIDGLAMTYHVTLLLLMRTVPNIVATIYGRQCPYKKLG